MSIAFPKWPKHISFSNFFLPRELAPRRSQDGSKTASYFQLAADPLTSKFQWASFSYVFSYVLATLGHLTSNLSLTCFQDAILLEKLPPRRPCLVNCNASNLPTLASKILPCWPSCFQDGFKLLLRPQLGPNLAQLIIPNCVQYVAVRPPPGPRSAGLNPAATLGA